MIYKQHQAEKKSAREFRAQLKEVGEKEEGVAVAGFDFQKLLLCLYGQTLFVYSLQRLRNDNFAITNIRGLFKKFVDCLNCAALICSRCICLVSLGSQTSADYDAIL